ncbi:cation channel sperm-associated auxiliary subunit epsilon-like [Amphiura filiformis]|uniref:cation channel sperm-associated auxiliary subunit epsilon-like n=1 Tax=Amphiura filiformis TaxID=82378 RepID=UPI003B210DB2
MTGGQRRAMAWDWQNFEADADHLTSGKDFLVEILDHTKEAEWKVSHPCSVQNKSAAVTSVNCVGAGFYPISSITEDANETQFIQVRESPLCYNWYIIATLNQRSNGTTAHKVWVFQVWVVDPQHASADEIQSKAQQPSKPSRIVTQNMKKRGQIPTLLLKRRKRDQHLHSQSITWNSNTGAWVIEVNMQFQYEILLVVKGKPEVAVNGCLVRDTSLILSLPKFINMLHPPLTGMDAEKLHGDLEGRPQLIQDPCTSSVALLVQSDVVSLTQDNFKSFSTLYLLKQFILDNSLSSLVVLRAAFTPTDLLLLIDGAIIAMDKDTGIFKAVPGLPPPSMKLLKGRHHCMPSTVEQLNIIHAVAWGADSQAFYLYYGKDTTSSSIFKQVMILMELLQPFGFNNNANVNIHDIAFDCPSGKLGVLANVTQDVSHALVILVYNTVTNEWTNLPYWIDDVQDGMFML